MQVISGPASVHWREPEKLKFLLAPVIAHSKAEQERFYAIFDQYYAELLTVATEADKEEATGVWFKKLRAWLRKWWWTLPALIFLLALSYALLILIHSIPSGTSKSTSIGYSSVPTPIRVGDTATFRLRTKNIDTLGAKIHWRLLDKKSGHVEDEIEGTKTWQLPFPELKGAPEKALSVEVYEKRRDTTFRYQGDLTIECAHPPQLDGLDLPGNLPPGEAFTFAPNVVDETKDLQFFWDFGDNQTSTERSPTHRYREEGSYTVELKVTRTGQTGFCTTSTSATMRVGEDQVYLPWYDLQYDPIRTRATFGWLPWALLFFLAVATFYFIFRWAKTQRPVVPPPERGQPRGLPLQSPDRPPYDIPFRPLNGLIRNLTGQFRLADALRRRQEGLRQEVDVPKTVDVTIASGGFPRLQFRNTTKPADYLFLVDEQNEISHQGRLLRHLVKVLHDQDVHAEVFYYRSEFFHFWNPQYPQGITLEQISRLCPEHRLVVFGDAHALLDPYGQTDKALRPEAVADFQRWKQRLLLSPRPPQSWDFREANIHNLLPIFPADLEGQMAAANFIDNGMAPEDLPSTFATWREKLAASRTEPDINRRWRSASDHAEYLGYGSDLYRWFCALALYPTPTWEITLAVGAAMDIPLNADNLLLLARIPSLQEGKINPRLRKEMLADLQLYDEELARTAIANELEASLAEATSGFAHRTLQSNLAVQRFALSPFNEESKTQVKSLLAQGWFNRLQIEDMGGVAVRELTPLQRPRRATKGGFAQQMRQEQAAEYTEESVAQQSNMANFRQADIPLLADENTLRRFLEEYGEQVQREAPEVEKPPKPKTINREFWQMIACVASALILIFVMMTLDSSPRLHRWAFGTNPEQRVYDPKVKMRGNPLVKEAVFIDSAAILNNQAVQLYREQAFGELQKTASGPSNSPQTYAYPPQVRNLLERALKADQTHSSAALNLARLNYNIGVAYYRAARNGSRLQAPDSLALLQFQQNDSLVDYFAQKQLNAKDAAAFNALHAASKHALGVIFYLINTTNDPYLAEVTHGELQAQGFFDTTIIRPNLATLLQKEPSRIYDIFPSTATETSLQVQVNYYTNPNRDKSLRLRLTALERRAGNSSAVATYVPRQERQAQARDGNERFTLQANLIKPGDQRRTDSLRVELVRINPNPRDFVVVAKLSIPYPKTWGKAAQVPDEEVAYFNGRIVDAGTGGPLRSEANVSWEWLYRDRRKIPGRMSSTNGNITIRQTLSRVATLTLRVSAEGYRPYERSFTQAELQRMNEKLPEVRMVPLEQQSIDTRQQEQANNSGRSNYTPIQPEMVRVNGGTFTMGCIDGRDKDCNTTVKPAHEVTLSTYFIGKYEVTNAEFAIFLNDIIDNPTRFNYPNEEEVEAHQWGLQKVASSGKNRWAPAKGYEKYPVINISWNWADAYCTWLSRQTGEKYHLPSEAEWEYAARGGQASVKNRFLYAGSDQIAEVAWYADNAKRTNPVGQKRPNQLDIYDMSGNVYEWCQDWYGSYTAGNQTNPSGPVSGRERVMRGGSFGMFEESMHLVAREKNYPNLSNQNLGFRVARTP